ncbi:MAG: D-tyrosyl-tRNA(Tyr) deacylase [Verrucomicrobia bacterium]|nr:D-tyrosyl-tRNA(Tyr) deacylase [Verrucomicrobiota bacterium]
MRMVVQRVSRASVVVDGGEPRRIGRGLVVLLGITHADTRAEAEWLAGKLPVLRIFPDEEGKMNRSLSDFGGEVLVVSQFTLFGTLRKGTRPSFMDAARPEQAIPLYEHFLSTLRGLLPRPVVTGEFGADMQIELVNDGPVTLVIDTPGAAREA